MSRYVLDKAITPVPAVKITTDHQTTRMRPIRSDSQPPSTPPNPMPISVYVLSRPAATVDN
jgi:hypothetical protein